MKLSAAFVVVICALTLTLVAGGADWPEYRGPQGDGVSQEKLPTIDWKRQPPEVVWKAPTPLGFSSFVVADGRAFTLIAEESAAGETVAACVALDAETGKRLWTAQLGSTDYGHDGGNSGAPGNRGGDGPRATPATDGQRVFVYDAHLVLRCFDAGSGEIQWQRDVVKEFSGRNIKWYNAISPVLDGDLVYIAGGGPGQSFLAFNKNSGKLAWKSGDEMITHATPQVAKLDGVRQIIYFVQSGLVGVDAASGKELWRTKFPFSVSTAASPITDGRRVYCSAGYGVGAGVFEVDGRAKAEAVWFKPNELMNHWSTPVLHDGHLYGIYEFKKYGRAPLQCVDLATGEIKWSERGFGPGNCILVDGKLIVLSDAGEVVVVEAQPAVYHEAGRFKAVDGKCWSTPAYSDGRIYVRSTVEGACLKLE